MRDVCFLFPYHENTEIRSAYIFRAPGCFISRQIWVNFSGWWFWAILIWWALTMAARQVSQNSRPIVPEGFPRPSSREHCWIAHALFCRLWRRQKGVCKGGLKEAAQEQGEDWLLSNNWVVSQCFPVSLLHQGGGLRTYFKPYGQLQILEQTITKS